MTFLSFLLASFQSHFLWTFLPPRTAASRCLRHSLFHWRHTTVQRAMSATWAARWQETPDPMLPGTETMSASTPTLTTISPTHVGSAPWWYSKSGPRTAGITPSWQRTIWAEWSVQLSLLSKVKKKTHQNYLLQLKSTLLAACLYCSLLSLLFQIRMIQLPQLLKMNETLWRMCQSEACIHLCFFWWITVVMWRAKLKDERKMF